MSTITNEPILLDSTGRAIVEQMNRHNSYLAMLAEGRRNEIYSSMSQIASIVRGNDVETNKKIFPIGDQIIMPWKDMDDSAHNTDETAYQIAWDIVHHENVELLNGRIVPGMFLQMHKCSAYGVQFSHQQAFKNSRQGLTAGTYSITFGEAYGSKDAAAGSTWQFTLTQNIPAGGLLSGFERMDTQAASTFKVTSWASASAAEPIETVNVTAGSGGVHLGTLMLKRSEGGVNAMQRVAYGHNRWSTSALRQYLNSAGNSWWTSKDDFDIRPDQYEKQGFMSGFNEDFLSAIKPIKVTTALNTVENFGGVTEDTFDTFFLPSLEQMNTNQQLSGAEGSYFEYWRQRLGLNGFAGWYSGNTFDAYKIPAINNNASQLVRLRSAVRGNAYGLWNVDSSGFVGNYYASHSLRFTPVCVVC